MRKTYKNQDYLNKHVPCDGGGGDDGAPLLLNRSTDVKFAAKSVSTTPTTDVKLLSNNM